MPYTELQENQPASFNWRTQTLRIACCDCGKVDAFKFSVRGDRITLKGSKDELETWKMRRKNKKEL